ncbi:hypothetical protein BKA64DRAFT_708813 [Cadophora sp. MPI-SDFR-AT-0126]|nr:hypothetical protein BKA64DRAFT_708813 [Leotiomycetes sp. MPI-SDFR-AT-0126]
MAPSDTYSTTAVDGSTDKFGPSSSVNDPKTPAQVAADKLPARERMQLFMSDSALSTLVTGHGANTIDAVSARRDAAAAKINSFDGAFEEHKPESCKDDGKK